jgi:outer membrane protein
MTMRFFRHAILLALIATPFLPLPVQAAPMSLVDAVSFALDHSPTVAEKVSALANAEHALAQARNNAFPPINGSLSNYSTKSANYQGAYGVIGATQQNVFSQNTAQLSTTYNLTTGGLSFLQLASARATASQARENLASSEDNVATTVASAYYQVMQNQAIVAVDEADLKYQSLLVNVAKAKERAGMVAGVDVLKAQVQEAKSASTLAGAQADVANARENLAQAIGAPLDQVFAFKDLAATPPSLPKGSVEKLEEIALNARPDLKAARESLIASRQTRKGWSRELFPTIAITAAMGNQLSPTTQQYGSIPGCVVTPVNPCVAPVARQGTPGFWTIGAQTTFALPLVDYNQRHSERVADDAAVSAAELTVDQTQRQVELDVRQSYRGAQTALLQVAYARRESQLGTESARIAQLQYQRGLIALADVIQTQQQSVIAQSDFVNARIAYINSLVKLRVSLGIYDARSAVADLP